ncbi:MAG: MBL fold metallo-hydrolase [Planctomycetota bacterium]|nr:MBL fold metallo-hydrolase [Planctomycetota bacterium]
MNTSRRGFLQFSAGLLALGALPGLADAEEKAAAAKPADKSAEKSADKAPEWFSGPIVATRIEDGLFLLDGAGGNSVAMFEGDRLLVVDSGVPKRGADLLAAAMKLAPAAAAAGAGKTLFNTHWHFDHTGGNGDFVKAGFTVVGSGACRARMGQKIVFEDMGMTMEPSPDAARPSVTFDDKLKLYEPSPVAVTKIAPAHTDTDAVLLFEKQNVLHTGDLLFSGMFPVIDRSSGGSLDGMIASSKQLHGMCDDKTRVVPGHGPLGSREPLKAQHELLLKVRELLAPYGEKKRPMDEVLKAAPLAGLDAQWGKGFLQSPIFTRMAYGQWLTRG